MLIGFAIYFFYGISHSKLNGTGTAPFMYKAMTNDDSESDDGEVRQLVQGARSLDEPDEVFSHKVVAGQDDVAHSLLDQRGPSPDSTASEA